VIKIALKISFNEKPLNQLNEYYLEEIDSFMVKFTKLHSQNTIVTT